MAEAPGVCGVRRVDVLIVLVRHYPMRRLRLWRLRRGSGRALRRAE